MASDQDEDVAMPPQEQEEPQEDAQDVDEVQDDSPQTSAQQDQATGSDNEATGSDNEATGSDNGVPGSDNEAAGSDNEATGSDNEAPGSDNEATGSDKNDGEQDEEEVEMVEGTEQRSQAKTEALMAAKGFVTPATLEAEFQCIICQYAMFKPVTVFCGHSFCRVCLMDSFLTRSIEEAQCPICRVEILEPLAATSSPTAIFNVNVTLWNAVQLLIPSVADRISSYQTEEEEEYTRKLDQLDAKWKIFFLTERAARYHGDHEEVDLTSSPRATPAVDEATPWEEQRDGHSEYPVLKVEDNNDGNLYVTRNVVLDISDANEDGIMNMRVGLAIVEFPSIFELYNEHQECSLNVIKLEEDEEMAEGMPFFMSETGDDDVIVCGSYYNEITLRVCDDGGNCVMERTRGAQAGVVNFPGMRLDVPGGMYTFRFSDDLYGLKLSITMQLREPHEISDAPTSRAAINSFFFDEARDARRGHRSPYSDDEGANDDEESDDSFIVNDLDEPASHFSDNEGGEQVEYSSDDEAADEDREWRRMRRRQQHSRGRPEREVQLVEEHEDDMGEEAEHDGADDQDEDEHSRIQSGRRSVQLVSEQEEATFSSDEEARHEEDDDHQGAEEEEDQHGIARSRRRNANQILDSEDEDEEEEPADGEEDTEQHEGNIHDDAAEDEEETEELIRISDALNGNADAVDDSEDEVSAPTRSDRKVTREQWEQGEESDAEDSSAPPDAAFSEDGESESGRRPAKRARKRNVRIVESDGEDVDMERSVEVARLLSGNVAHDEDADEKEEAGSDSQSQQANPFYEEDVEDQHVYDDAQQDEGDGGPDYPDEEDNEDDRFQEEGQDFAGEFSE